MEGIKIEGVKGEICFNEPYILNKETLAFKGTNIKGFHVPHGNIILNEKEQGIEIRSNDKRYLIGIDKEEFKRLVDYRKKEADKANEFFKKLASDKETIRVYVGENILVKSEASLNIGFAPYYDKILRFLLQKNTNGVVKDTDEGEFQAQLGKILTKKLDLNKFKIVNDGDGDYIRITVTTLCKYITA